MSDKMNAEIKAQWVAALRSGDYTQGRDRLVTINPDGSKEYCCLGVLCDLAVKSGLGIRVEDREMHYGNLHALSYADGQLYGLPVEVEEWAGMPGDGTLVELDGMDHDVAGLNDSGHSFMEIADLIERDL